MKSIYPLNRLVSMSNRKIVRELKKLAEPFGYKFDGVTKGGHLRFRGPGGVVFASATPSCRRSSKNFVREIKRSAARVEEQR